MRGHFSKVAKRPNECGATRQRVLRGAGGVHARFAECATAFLNCTCHVWRRWQHRCLNRLAVLFAVCSMQRTCTESNIKSLALQKHSTSNVRRGGSASTVRCFLSIKSVSNDSNMCGAQQMRTRQACQCLVPAPRAVERRMLLIAPPPSGTFVSAFGFDSSSYTRFVCFR